MLLLNNIAWENFVVILFVDCGRPCKLFVVIILKLGVNYKYIVVKRKELQFQMREREFLYKIYSEIPWQELNNKRILITGVSGMIGSTLIRMLLEYSNQENANLQVVGISRSKETARKQLGDIMDTQEFTYISGDINMPLENMGSFDYIIHCASNTHPRQYSSDPIGTIMTNVLGTKNLLDYAVKYGVKRFVFLSSVEIYGENRGDVDVFGEEYLGYIDCNTLRSGYPEGKRLGESMCNAYAKQQGIDFVIPRLSRTYGPGLLETDSKAISQFIHKASAREDIVLKSKGDQLFSYTYAEDAASAVLLVMLKGESGEAYNVSDAGSVLTLAELAGILADIAGTKVIFELPDEVEKAGYSTATKAVLDASKLEALGWSARVHMREGLERMIGCIK